MDVLLQQASEGEELALLAEFTGELFVKLEICGGDARLAPRFVAVCEAHSRLVRDCVPPSRLFAARLDPSFNRTGLDALGPFLGCQYRMPPDGSWGVFGQRGVT